MGRGPQVLRDQWDDYPTSCQIWKHYNWKQYNKALNLITNGEVRRAIVKLANTHQGL